MFNRNLLLSGRIYKSDKIFIRRQRRETDHSIPSSAEVKNDGAIPPLPLTSSWRDA
jgi:hypothetical protein